MAEKCRKGLFEFSETIVPSADDGVMEVEDVLLDMYKGETGPM
ncbi:hypothetical protein C5167_000147 [Papaver somniferum]|uniref:Uncharacterized protein n=1 Tax=Papaver somniferum TaxID=3469 RepID=A0A4Y7KV23_PAPSO|nr:hypothetical protein C5167_000147 [Papaver somniferum]